MSNSEHQQQAGRVTSPAGKKKRKAPKQKVAHLLPLHAFQVSTEQGQVVNFDKVRSAPIHCSLKLLFLAHP